MRHTFVVGFSLCLALLSGSARADVLIVDNVGVLPDHHATLQGAVDAAAPGDTILVRFAASVLNENLVIDGKGLTVMIDVQDEVEVIRSITVRNLPSGQTLTMQGFRAISTVSGPALRFEDNAGKLVLYDVTGSGKPGDASGSPTGLPRDGGVGAIIDNCPDITLTNCGFGGGAGGDVLHADHYAPSNGGLGARISNSNVTAYWTQVAGGWGGEIDFNLNTQRGGNGGTGLITDNATVFFYGDGPRGGHGGDGLTGGGGHGGTGLVQDGAGAIYRHYTAPAGGGVGGQGGFPGQDGNPGIGQQILGGQVVNMQFAPGFARQMWTTTPVREGEPIQMTVTGFEDDVWMLYGFEPGNQLFPEYQGSLALTPPFSDLIYLGEVPFLAAFFSLGNAPELPPGFDIVDVTVQCVIQLVPGQYSLINPDHIVILDSSF